MISPIFLFFCSLIQYSVIFDDETNSTTAFDDMEPTISPTDSSNTKWKPKTWELVVGCVVICIAIALSIVMYFFCYNRKANLDKIDNDLKKRIVPAVEL